MRRYGETIAVTGLLTRSEKLGPIVTMDGGGWWSVWLNCFQARHIGHRVTIEGQRVGYNDLAAKRVTRV
ncbi:MAG: hypothetical protein IPF48_11155 [Sphingomonadales bacterium]|nr:hypothetical protein [Sphingomonadales bacterium]MBK6491469.1 hypothetical protein [Sphingomonadales bacterium]MBK6721575.1 hypothetical protein [Sphingomonadales bacterium]MBK8273560.1 hypothetical protein [Sphingomonadales bacterium]MBK9588908.1 hypothetical protein [Sphingomonadales bacterium]